MYEKIWGDFMNAVIKKSIIKRGLTESELNKLEDEIPKLASQAVKIAYENARKAGRTVVKAVDGIIYNVLPDGQEIEIKKIAKPRKINPNNRKFHLIAK